MKRAREVAHAVARVTCCEHPVLGWSHSITCDDLTTAITARDAEHRAELDALRKSYEDANARGGEANERLRAELAEAEKRADALESLIDTERQARKEAENTLVFVRRELAEARGQWICSAGHRHGPHDVCNNPFPPAATPAESTPVQATPALEHDKNVIDGLRQNAQADEIDRRAIELRHPHPAPPDGIRERLERLEKRMDEYAAALEAKGEPGTHAVGRPGWRTPHRFVPGMWPHANECREETRSPNNESCGLPSSDSIHKGAKP